MSIRAPKYINQKLTELKWEIKNNAIIVGNFNTLLSTDRPFRQNINKLTADLNIIDEMDLTDIYRTSYPTTEEYTVFSNVHELFLW